MVPCYKITCRGVCKLAYGFKRFSYNISKSNCSDYDNGSPDVAVGNCRGADIKYNSVGYTNSGANAHFCSEDICGTDCIGVCRPLDAGCFYEFRQGNV